VNVKTGNEDIMQTRFKTRRSAQQFSAATVLLFIWLIQTAHAQQSITPARQGGAAHPTVKPEAEEGGVARPAKAGGEGIKVHGHWMIDLRNPDGKLVEHRDFYNSLVTGGGTLSGDQILAALITGDATPGGLAVAFISGPTTTAGIDVSSFCNSLTTASGPGTGGLSAASPAGISCFGFLNSAYQAIGTSLTNPSQLWRQSQSGLSMNVSFSPSVNIVLSGNFTVPTALGTLGTVNAVQTYAALCVSLNSVTSSTGFGGFRFFAGSNYPPQEEDYSPQECADSPATGNDLVYPGALTSTNLGTPLKVTISFS
jgi:hypothetical protein